MEPIKYEVNYQASSSKYILLYITLQSPGEISIYQTILTELVL